MKGEEQLRVFYTRRWDFPGALSSLTDARTDSRIIRVGAQGAARPRRGLSPPEDLQIQGSNEPPFRPLLRTPGLT